MELNPKIQVDIQFRLKSQCTYCDVTYIVNGIKGNNAEVLKWDMMRFYIVFTRIAK